jgi:hypothetical protein
MLWRYTIENLPRSRWCRLVVSPCRCLACGCSRVGTGTAGILEFRVWCLHRWGACWPVRTHTVMVATRTAIVEQAALQTSCQVVASQCGRVAGACTTRVVAHPASQQTLRHAVRDSEQHVKKIRHPDPTYTTCSVCTPDKTPHRKGRSCNLTPNSPSPRSIRSRWGWWPWRWLAAAPCRQGTGRGWGQACSGRCCCTWPGDQAGGQALQRTRASRY